jgi:hypothetical protein
MIVELLRRISDERVIQLTYLGEKLTTDYEILGAIRGVRNMLQTPDHPAKKLFRGILEYLPSKNRTIIFNTLFNNPHIFREVIEESKPYFTHKGAEEIVTSMEEEIDAYAARYGDFADRVWREEYLNQPSATTSCASSSIGASMSMKSN